MKQGKHIEKKVRAIDKYLVLFIIASIFMGIAYAEITTQELTVTGDIETEMQDGVFISDITSSDTTNGKVNLYTGTMMDTSLVLQSTSTSITYQVSMHNNTNREQIFIKALTDGTDETLYSNPNIGYTITGLTEGETTISPGGTLNFTITFAYKTGASTSNNTLNSKLNFRFREKPVIELSNVGATYTLEKTYPGYTSPEYEFTVKNSNEIYTNQVPMTYIFETTMTDGSPFVAEIYDANGTKVTGEATLTSDGTKEEKTYTLKLIWDSSKTETTYFGKEINCNIKLKATPTDTKYLDYTIEKEFNIEITTCGHEYEDGIRTICGYECSPHAWSNGTCTKCGKICIHNYVNGTCTTCGFVEGVYAILYSDGDLRFNTTGRIDASKTEAGNTVVMQSADIKSLAMTAASQPWASNITSITSVTIEEEIKPKNTTQWFNGCSKLTKINNISNLNTADVTNMKNMFYNCSSLATLDVTGFNTAKVTDMEEMFRGCSSLTTLDLTNWDVSKVTSMYGMFRNCTNIQSIYLGEFNAVNVTHMGYMFSDCHNLSTLDTSNFSTSSKLGNTRYMFNFCQNIQTLDLSKFNTTNVTSMQDMFYQCKKLTNVNLSSFNTAKVTDMQLMFALCSSLTTLDLSNFTATKLTNTYGMFSDCTQLQSINLSSFNTSSVTSMYAMFYNCSKLTLLDMRQATFDAVTSSNLMFGLANTNIKVIVKDAGEETNVPKTWIEDKLGGKGTVYTVKEWQAAGGE